MSRREFINDFEVYVGPNRRDLQFEEHYKILNDKEIEDLELPALPTERSQLLFCKTINRFTKPWHVRWYDGYSYDDIFYILHLVITWRDKYIVEFMKIKDWEPMSLNSIVNAVLLRPWSEHTDITYLNKVICSKAEMSINFLLSIKDLISESTELQIRRSIISVLDSYEGSELTNNYKLKVPVKNVILNEISFGDYIITIDLWDGNIIVDGGNLTYDNYYHPHVDTSGQVCMGDAIEDYLMSLIRLDFLNVIELIEMVLRTYNKYSAFASSTLFRAINAATCYDCGCIEKPSEEFQRDSQGNYFCEKCRESYA